MSISIKSTIKCSLSCAYCYEDAIRLAGNDAGAYEYDMEAIIQQSIFRMNSQKEPLVLHGGEPLLMKKEDIETLFKLSYDEFGSAGIQTNGELIDNDHIKLFKKYNVSVGISLDGFGECNLARWKGSREATLKSTKTTWKNIVKLREEDIYVEILTVVSRKNGLKKQRKAMKKFIQDLKAIGITRGQFNPVEIDDIDLRNQLELTPTEIGDFFTDMADYTFDLGVHWSPFRDVVDALLNLSPGSCIFQPCDWFATKAETVIMSNGEAGNCTKTAKDGVMSLRDEFPGNTNERCEMLIQIPMEKGGCGGCPFWNICTGLCPAQTDDWREKSRFCQGYYALYDHLAKKLRALMPNIHLSIDHFETIYDGGMMTFEKLLSSEYQERSSWKNSPKVTRGHIGKMVEGGLINE